MNINVSGSKLAAIGAVVVLASVVLAACDDPTPSNGAQRSGQAQTEQAFAQQQAAVPYPADALKDSLERRNLRERLLRTNNASKVGYVYLLSFSGQPLGYYVIKGKVSSTQSQMTTDNLIQTNCHSSNGCNDVAVNAPGDDGSYGQNEAGEFFFTVEGAFVETSLNYLYSDQPLPLNVPKLNSPAK
jgi:hypothetical protein